MIFTFKEGRVIEYSAWTCGLSSMTTAMQGNGKEAWFNYIKGKIDELLKDFYEKKDNDYVVGSAYEVAYIFF